MVEYRHHGSLVEIGVDPVRGVRGGGGLFTRAQLKREVLTQSQVYLFAEVWRSPAKVPVYPAIHNSSLGLLNAGHATAGASRVSGKPSKKTPSRLPPRQPRGLN